MKVLFIFIIASWIMVNPSNTEKPILTIGRSVDKNEVHYFVNTTSTGELVTDQPIKLLWKNSKKGSYESLNWIKKKYGYGVVIDSKNAETISFHFVSYKKKQFYLKKNQRNQFAIYSTFDNKTVEVKEIFVNIEGGSFWTPHVTHIDIMGMDENTKDGFQYKLIP
jgi:hypothetical protein